MCEPLSGVCAGARGRRRRRRAQARARTGTLVPGSSRTEQEPRVLLVCGAADPRRDGVAGYAARLAAALTDSGARVRTLHTGPPARGSVGAAWGPLAMLRAARAMRSADVVHVQFAPSMYRFRAWVGLLPLVASRTPVVVTLHEYGWWRWERLLPEAAWRHLERRGVLDRESVLLVPRSRAVVTTNAAHAAVVRDRFGRTSAVVPIGANVEVAPGVDRAVARREVRAERALAPDAVLLAFFGFVHPVKGVRYLAEAVARLAAEGRDVHALVVGGVESMALPADEAAAFERDLRADLAAAGAAHRVELTGFLESAAASRLLAASDVAVLPFTHGVTAKSGSLLTVMAHGLPTVVTAPPGGEPELPDGARCVVVPRVRDGAALADGIRRVLDDPALAERIGAAGAAWAAERDWAAIAARHRDVYRAAIG